MTKLTKRIKARQPPVRFKFSGAGVNEVCIAGTFNEWHPSATQMIDLGDGNWVKELMLPPGRHEYLFVVDGRWLPDPGADDAVPNRFGGWNSVREVRPAY